MIENRNGPRLFSMSPRCFINCPHRPVMNGVILISDNPTVIMIFPLIITSRYVQRPRTVDQPPITQYLETLGSITWLDINCDLISSHNDS